MNTRSTEPDEKKLHSRRTKQQQAILDILEDSPDFLSAQQLFERVKAQGDAGSLTTTYRVLQKLESEKLVDSLVGTDQQVLYRKCSNLSHHHHLVCIDCNKTVEIAEEDIEEFAQHVVTKNGFSHVYHTLEIFGLCQQCTMKH